MSTILALFVIYFLHILTFYPYILHLEEHIAMKRISTFFLSFVLTFSLMLSTHSGISAATADEYRILFLSSYSYGWDTVQIQIEGIKKGITDDVVLDYEFMDTKRFPGKESIDVFYEGLSYRMSHAAPYDALIVGDDAALHFAIEHRDDLFKDMPIIFEGVNDIEYAKEVSKDPLITGVVEDLSITSNIDFGLKLYPDAGEVIAILDNSITGEAERSSFYSIAPLYPSLTFSEINCSELTSGELIDRLSGIPENTILIYIVMTEDASGRQYTSLQSVNLISTYSKVPAIRMVSGGIGYGLPGGNIVSMELSGQLAAEMANEIVHGKNPAEYTSIIDSPNIYCIDEAVMRRYGLDLKLIPKDARIINHTPTFIEKYHIILMPITIIMLLLLIIIVFLLLRSIKQYFLTRELYREKKKIAEDSTYDFLTGLSNRSKLYSDLNMLGSSHASYALFIFDIDGFKQINDTYGHQAGDEVLTELGKRISSVKNPAFTPYRLAGDEFICIYRTRNHERIDECARHCMELFEPDFKIKDLSISVKISLGIAVSPDDCIDVEKLIECADKAMYTVKKNGKNSYAWYADIKEK